MLLGRMRVSGLVGLVLVAATACSSAADPSAPRRDAAVASYSAPAGAPDFCTTLAGGGDLVKVPDAIGVLTVAPHDVEATLALSGAIDELRHVLREMTSQGGSRDVEESVGNLVSALQEARDGTVSDTVRTAVVTGLDDLGAGVQPMCEFPT